MATIGSWMERLWYHRADVPRATPTAPDPEDPNSWKSLDYIHDRVVEQLKQQHDIWDMVDGRLRLILGVISIVFAVTIGFQRSQSLLALPVGLLTIVALVVYLVAALLVAIAYWPRDFDWPPRPAGLRALILIDPRETKLQVIDSIIESYNLNGRAIALKIALFKVAYVLTALATILLSVAVIGNVWSQTSGLGALAPTPTVLPSGGP